MNYFDSLVTVTLEELLAAPIYIAIILFFATKYRNKRYSDPFLRKLFYRGLLVKLFGGVAFGLIYSYYYRGGDTFWFYQGMTVFYEAFTTDLAKGLELVFTSAGEYHPSTLSYTYQIWWFTDPNSFTVIKIGGVLSLLAFNNYIAITIFFAFFSFTGVWKIFTIYYDYYPDLAKKLGIAFFFVPTVAFWSSGVSKDALALGFIGWVLYSFYKLFIKKERKLKYMILFFVASYFILQIRGFLFFIIFPSLIIWYFFHLTTNIKNKVLRVVGAPFLLIVLGLSSLVVISASSGLANRYSLDQLEKRAYDTQWWHTKVQENEGDVGSHYTLGTPTRGFGGIVQKIPAAINVTFFRPYPWEANNFVMMLAALESLVIFFLTIRIVIRTGVFRSVKLITSSPILIFSVTFALVIAFAVGYTSYNFGALVRYKAPCIPIFIAALFIIDYHAKRAKKLSKLERTE